MSQHDEPRSPAQAGAATSISPAPPYHLLVDIFRGIFKGAYAVEDLRTPGLLAWIVVGFVPVLGTLAAARDALYSLEVREWGALLLNLIGLLPFMKGFANILEVAQLRRLHHVAHIRHQVMRVARGRRLLRAGKSGEAAAAVTGLAHEAGAVVLVVNKRGMPLRNAAAWPAFLLAFVTALFLPLVMGLVLAVVAGSAHFAHAIPLPFTVGSTVVALLYSTGVLVLARHARRTASALKGQPLSRGAVSTVAVWLAWLGFLVTLAIVVIVLLYAVRGTPPVL